MLTNAAYLKDMVIRATDGDIGTVDQFYFDDKAWVIRYLTVETGGWLGDRQVLISPISICPCGLAILAVGSGADKTAGEK